jgi:hypothetical protein
LNSTGSHPQSSSHIAEGEGRINFVFVFPARQRENFIQSAERESRGEEEEEKVFQGRVAGCQGDFPSSLLEIMFSLLCHRVESVNMSTALMLSQLLVDTRIPLCARGKIDSRAGIFSAERALRRCCRLALRYEGENQS